MPRARQWLADNPSRWVVALEASVRVLNTLLVAVGLGVAAWALATFIQIQQAQVQGPSPTAAALLLGTSTASDPFYDSPSDLKGIKCPWFVYAFGAVGLVTAAAGGTALGSTALRSVAWASANVWVMVLALAAQAIVGVAAWLDRSWQHRLPPADEAAKRWLATRLAVVRWTAAGLAIAQLLTLLLGCGLQAAYTAAEEAAEDAEDDEAWRRRPLLRGAAPPPGLSPGGGRQRASTPPVPSSGRVSAAGRSPPSAGRGSGGDIGEEAAWQDRMRQRYGLDPSQFGAGAAGPGAAGGRTSRRPRRRRGGGEGDDDDDGGSSDSDAGGGRCVVS